LFLFYKLFRSFGQFGGPISEICYYRPQYVEQDVSFLNISYGVRCVERETFTLGKNSVTV